MKLRWLIILPIIWIGCDRDEDEAEICEAEKAALETAMDAFDAADLNSGEGEDAYYELCNAVHYAIECLEAEYGNFPNEAEQEEIAELLEIEDIAGCD